MSLHPGHIAATTPDRPAVIIGDAVLTYGALDAGSLALAAWLHKQGLRQGDTIALLIANRPEFFVASWAAHRSGLYYVPIPTRLTPAEVAHILTDSGAALLFVDPDLRPLAEAAARLSPIRLCDMTIPDADEPPPPAIEGADMLYTSGTTGRPRGVRQPITGEPLGSDSRRVNRARQLFGLGADSIFLSPAPLYHAAPLRFSMNLLRTGGTVVAIPRFDAAAALALIACHGVTHSQWVPTMFARLLALPENVRMRTDLSSHRVAIHAGAPCPPYIKRRMIDWWGPILHEYYSGTESIGFTHATSAEWLERPGTVGRAFGSTIHILGDDGCSLAAGETGTVHFEGSAPLSYHGDADKTAAAHSPQGWATMGDVGHVDADGYLFLTDRRAFTIISGGVNIYPAEVEAVLASHPSVQDCAVFGVPDADLGETVFALVEPGHDAPANPALADALSDHLRERLAPWKVPRIIRFGRVGRTETGKVAKATLRETHSRLVATEMTDKKTRNQQVKVEDSSMTDKPMPPLFTVALASASALALMAPPANAQAEAQAADAGLADIVVTAQKRQQNLQDVPAAISAFSAEDLALRGITQTSDLMGTLPNLQVTSAYGSTQPNFSLRGISVANEFSASTASPVGVYVDEVYQSFRASHGQQLFDLDRVEVLRGPQGTLYGRNTTGGAVNFITRRPGLGEANGFLTVGYSNYSTLRMEGAAEATLVPDALGIRVAGVRARGDGYTFNPTLDRNFATTDSLAGRITARWKPSETLDITLKAFGAQNDPRQDIPYGIGYLQGRTNAGGYSRFDRRPELGGRTLRQDEIQADTAGRYFTSTVGFSLTVDAELSDSLTLTSITGYDSSRFRLSPFDCDGSPIDICAIRYNSQSKNFNQDLRLAYDGDRLRVIGGLYYGKDEINTQNEPDFFGFLRPLLLGAGVPGGFTNIPIGVGNSLSTIPAFALDPSLTPTSPGFCAPIVINPGGLFDARSLAAFQYDVATTNSAGGTAAQAACAAAGAAPFGPILADQRFTLSRPSTAIYGEAAYDITDALTVTLGLRYTWDKVRFEDGRTLLFDLAGTNAIASLVPYSFPYNPSLPAVDERRANGQFTGRLVLDYSFTDEMLGYASYSRGYRAGTFNGLAYQDTSQVYFLDPEEVSAFEIGLKSRFADNRVQLNLAGFYYDYSNQQIAQIIGATSFLRSANGRVFGFEAELAAQVSGPLRFDAAFGYLNTEYRGNTVDLSNPASLTLDINGNRFPNAPEVTFSAGFDLTAYESGPHRVTLRGDTQYMGRYFFDPFGDYGQDPCDAPRAGTRVLQATPEIACGNPGYWLFNARATYSYDERISVSVWGRNIANKFYYTYGLNLNAFYQDYFTRGAPRTWGVEATIRF